MHKGPYEYHYYCGPLIVACITANMHIVRAYVYAYLAICILCGAFEHAYLSICIWYEAFEHAQLAICISHAGFMYV